MSTQPSLRPLVWIREKRIQEIRTFQKEYFPEAHAACNATRGPLQLQSYANVLLNIIGAKLLYLYI